MILLSILAFFFLGALLTIDFSGEHGKIFTKEEADSQFGPVLTSVELKTEFFQSILNHDSQIFMFKIIDHEIVILAAQRKLLYPGNIQVNDDDVFHVYSTSKIYELLELGKNDLIYFEQRQERFSITNGQWTLEYSGGCPPYC